MKGVFRPDTLLWGDLRPLPRHLVVRSVKSISEPPFSMSSMRRAERSKPFKQRKNLAARKHEVAGIRAKFPTKIPVILERYKKEKHLPLLDKLKFLVPEELTLSQFITVIRNRLYLMPRQAFYLLINNGGLSSMSLTMAEIYKDHKDEDGFLYMTYASQEMFGCPGAP